MTKTAGSKWYLGLSTTGHDPALAVIDPEGKVVFAEATERFIQVKRAWGVLPDLAAHVQHALTQTEFDPRRDFLEVCTSWSRIKAVPNDDLSHSVVNEALLTSLYEYLEHQFTGVGAAFKLLGLQDQISETRRFEHHTCHAATSIYFSDVDDGICLIVDGEGETGAISEFSVRARHVKRNWRSWIAGASLGLYYWWLTERCGFSAVKGEEWKVMGLAAFGKVRDELVAALSQVLVFKDHRPWPCDREVMDQVHRRIRAFERAPNEPIMKAADLAASGQYVYARFADQLVEGAMKHGPRHLLLGGGCALNSSYNGTILDRFDLDKVEVPPCPADDGNAIGAALLAWCQDHDAPIPRHDRAAGLGTRPNPKTVQKCAASAKPHFDVTEAGKGSAALVARKLADGLIVGVMRGPAEFGPRALGHRSILADPRPDGMKDRINRAVKGREAYRPFAPVVPEAVLGEWFQSPQPSPYMSKTLRWRDDQLHRVPAVVHEDKTGRVQTVTQADYPWLHEVVTGFGDLTGVPVILNTSLNIMGKPIVHAVEDTVALLMTTDLDAILLEDTLIEKRRSVD